MDRQDSAGDARTTSAESQCSGRGVWRWVFVAISAVNAVGVTLAVDGRWGRLHFPCVLGASTGFVLVALASGALRSGYGRLILAGLIAFWCGDVIGGQHYLVGMVAFCMGHGAFIAAYAAKGIAWRRSLAALPAMALALALILCWLLPHVVQRIDMIAVCAYSGLITTMVLAAAGASRGRAGRLLLAAALIIFVSDIFVARWRYVEPTAINGFLCYPLYYSACLMLALSVGALGPPSREMRIVRQER